MAATGAEMVGGVIVDIRAPKTNLERDLLDMKRLLDSFSKQADQTRQETEKHNRQMADSFKQTNKSLESMNAMFGQVRAALAIIGFDIGIQAVRRFISGNLEAAGSLGALAGQLGTTAESLQVYQALATQVNLGAEELNASVARLTRTIGAAAQGDKQAIETFDRLGIGVLDVAGNVRSTDEVLRAVMANLSNIKNPAEQARVAFDLFGRSGQRMLEFLHQGEAGLAKMRQELQDRGILLSSEQIAQANEASDALKRISAELQRLSQILAIKLSPWIIDLLHELNAAFLPTRAEEISQLTDRIERLKKVIAEGGLINFLIFGPKGRLQSQLDEAQSSLNDLHEVARRRGAGSAFFPAAAPERGTNPATKEQSDLNQSAQNAIEKARAQIEVQRALVEAYAKGPDAVLAAQRAIEALTKTQSSNEKFTKDQKDALAALNDELVRLQQQGAVEKTIAGFREEGQELDILLSARGRETTEIRTQLAMLKLRAQFGSEAASAAEVELRATEQKRTQVAASRVGADLSDESATLQAIINNRGIETNEIRVQTELLKLKRQFDDETVRSLEDQVRLVQQQRSEVQNIAALKQTADDLTRINKEAELRGADPEKRAVEMAVLEKEIQLRQRGVDLTSDQAVAEIQATRELTTRRVQLDQITQSYDVLAQIGEQAFDRIGSALTEMFVQGEGGAFSWRNIMLGVLSEVYQAMIRLAVINPLLNSIGLGGKGGLPTIVGVLGSIGLGALGSSGSGAGPVIAPNEAFLNAPHYAGGTDYARAGMAVVGEEGPELIRMRGGEQVIPAPQTARMLSSEGSGSQSMGSGPIFNVDMRGASADAVLRLEALVDSVNGRLNQVTREMPAHAVAAVVEARRRQPKLFSQRSK